MTNLAETNKDYAIFLPSISAVFAHNVSHPKDLSTTPRNGINPKGIPDSTYLNFLDKDKGIFYYDHALYSAGHAILDIEKSDRVESMVQGRDPNVWILGDSGGFQIGKGVIDFDFKDFTGTKANSVREKILRWLEHTSDHAMVLDIPPWAIGKQPGIETFESCLEATLFNNEYFIRNRTGDCKFMNVLQGRNKHESDIWFDAVKDMPFEGWAFAGSYTTDYEMTLRKLIEMRDDKLFEENSNGEKRTQLHFLGQSKLLIGCILTAIQRKLREQVDTDVTVSYDSASAFICSARGGVYTNASYDNKRFAYLMEKMYDNHSLIGSELPFPWISSVGERLTIGDICVRPKGWMDKDITTSWDTYSYILLMAHNVERHIRCIQQANRIFSLPHDRTGQLYVPPLLIEFQEVLNEVFDSEAPYDVISKYHKLLNKVAGRNTGRGVTNTNIFAELFEHEEEIFVTEDLNLENQEDERLLQLEKED